MDYETFTVHVPKTHTHTHTHTHKVGSNIQIVGQTTWRKEASVLVQQ